jgi:hypothetical protein
MKRIGHAVVFFLAFVSTSCGRNDSRLDMDFTTPSTMGAGYYECGATIDGEMTWWKVPFADVLRTPDWSPGSEPPLSLSQAVQLAEGEVPKYTQTPASYRLDKVEWLNITNGAPSKKWIYLVSFERDRELYEARGTITIPVLLNGSLVQGRSAKRPPN